MPSVSNSQDIEFPVPELAPCSRCGSITRVALATVVYEFGVNSDEAGIVCPRCFRDYRQCTGCGTYVHRGNTRNCMTTAGANVFLCNTCYGWSTISCQTCGTRYSPVLGQTHELFVFDQNGQFRLCQRCCNDYRFCTHCQRVVEHERMYTDEMCNACATERGLIVSVRNHSYKPISHFNNITPINTSLIPYIGLELEVVCPLSSSGRNTIRLDMARELHDAMPQNTIYFKEDGSLSAGGIEIVTHPMTLEFIEHHNIFATFERVLRNHKVLSGDTNCCGFHIHVSNTPFIESTWYKNTMADYLYRHYSEIVRISRRTNEQIDRWARIVNRGTNSYRPGSRYVALNIEPEWTYEFRFFRGSILAESLYSMTKFIYNFTTRCRNEKISPKSTFLSIPVDELWEGKPIQSAGDEIKLYV